MPKAKRVPVESQPVGHRKWKEHEIKQMLDYCLITIQENHLIEKPTALKYWNNFLKTVNWSDCSPKLLREKFRFLKDKYSKFSHWLANTGQTAEPKEVAVMMEKMCPHYNQLNELLSEKSNVNPPGGNELGIVHNEDDEQGPAAPVLNDILFDDGIELHRTENPDSFQDVIREVQFPLHFVSNSAPTSSDKQVFGAKKACKQSRMIDIFEAKSKVKMEEVNYEHKKLDFKKEKWTTEIKWRERQLSLEELKEKHRMEMDTKSIEVEMFKAEKGFDLEKYKLDKEVELQVKLAKIKQGIDV